MPPWIAALIGLAEALDPALTPFFNLGVALYAEFQNGVDFAQPQTFPSIPASIKGHQGTFTVTWAPK